MEEGKGVAGREQTPAFCSLCADRESVNVHRGERK